MKSKRISSGQSSPSALYAMQGWRQLALPCPAREPGCCCGGSPPARLGTATRVISGKKAVSQHLWSWPGHNNLPLFAGGKGGFSDRFLRAKGAPGRHGHGGTSAGPHRQDTSAMFPSHAAACAESSFIPGYLDGTGLLNGSDRSCSRRGAEAPRCRPRRCGERGAAGAEALPGRLEGSGARSAPGGGSGRRPGLSEPREAGGRRQSGARLAPRRLAIGQDVEGRCLAGGPDAREPTGGERGGGAV